MESSELIGTHQRSFERYYPQPPTASSFSKIGGSQPQPKTAIAIVSGSGATDCKFGQYIHRVHSNKSPLKIWEKGERGRMQGLPKCFEYPLLSQEWLKLWTSNFSEDRSEQKSSKNFGKSSHGRTRDSRKFSGHPYIGRIAQSSLR